MNPAVVALAGRGTTSDVVEGLEGQTVGMVGTMAQLRAAHSEMINSTARVYVPWLPNDSLAATVLVDAFSYVPSIQGVRVRFNHAWHIASLAPIRALHSMQAVSEDRQGRAMALVRQGFAVDADLDLGNEDPYTYMAARVSMGAQWWPSKADEGFPSINMRVSLNPADFPPRPEMVAAVLPFGGAVINAGDEGVGSWFSPLPDDRTPLYGVFEAMGMKFVKWWGARQHAFNQLWLRVL